MCLRRKLWFTNYQSIVEYLNKHNALYDDKEIYEYSIRIVISEAIATTLIILIGLCTHHFIEAILYEMILSTSRSVLGGYHCKTYTSCILFYIILFIVNLIISKVQLDVSMIVLIELVSLIITISCNPIINENKPISYKKKIKFKKISVIYILMLIITIHIMMHYNIQLYNFLIYVIITIQILTIGGKQNERKYKKKNIDNVFI